MRTALRPMPLLLLACLAGCDHAPPPGASIVEPAAAASMAPSPAPAAAATTAATTAADNMLAVAVARDAAARAAREQTLRVQKHLREQQRALQQARDAANHGNERCVAGQRMRRVANGWVEAGAC